MRSSRNAGLVLGALLRAHVPSAPRCCVAAADAAAGLHTCTGAGSKLFKAGEIPVLPDMLETDEGAAPAWLMLLIWPMPFMSLPCHAMVLLVQTLCCRCSSDSLLPPPSCPTAAAPRPQVSMWAMPLYAMLPTLTECCVEQGWTMAYTRCALELGTNLP